ncbi:hypothetical protein OEZ85_003390 [Tetradesmus obliquus]|uniref:RNA helicase n=1 Tax=Tetradesmus obliquus TaxID=3088 RepID=A0ABY8UBQ1_TETOB|nr:hypothetical protein OEZ85_003390 [Tetradesmus obliquus]
MLRVSASLVWPQPEQDAGSTIEQRQPLQQQPSLQQQPQQPWPAQTHAATYQQPQQQLQPPQQLQQQRAQQLLSRPSREQLGGAAQQQAVQQPSAARKRQLLDDEDPKMAAFNDVEVQVTWPRGVKRQRPAASFNSGPGVVRPVLAGNLRALRINRPTPLQGHMLPAIRAGHDLLAAGPPGAGTSSAALLGVLSHILTIPRSVPPNKAMPLALLLCPGRELAVQLAAQGAAMVAGSQLVVRCATGGSPVTQQVLELRRGADLLVATPGRLLDLLAKRTVSLARLKLLVMEDVDELMGPVLLPASRQAQRDEALQCFKYGVTQVLVACGIGYRGLDLPDVSQVVNFDVPLSLAEYARRLGRAGRAGRPGVGTTLVTPSDGAAVAALVAVLRAGGQAVPDWLLSVAEGGGSGSAGSSRDEESGGSEGDEEQQRSARSSSSSEGRRASGGLPALFSVRGRKKVQLGAYMDEENAQEQQPQETEQQ